MSELREHRIKRLKMRSMRRGIKEMDVILQPFAEANLDAMEEADLTLYDTLLSENDHDLYQWVSGQIAPPQAYVKLIDRIIGGLPRTTG
ncbi:succinate dehydrogenase assembly factor 2 [Roseobacter cerasinus]|uniref:FAD assembly factor SdhE n=1 Tax=Roseobacter cerasinus TaxID=2602289 RepID=A0A640VUU5_9RHOB|nr:succinate dehydrogenase assembly factor 2 [Roseobacter cerasinus]GFE51364.1 succinate dehydrogenase assembly factor 2 [Roseobacter cerasinus]